MPFDLVSSLTRKILTAASYPHPPLEAILLQPGQPFWFFTCILCTIITCMLTATLVPTSRTLLYPYLYQSTDPLMFIQVHSAFRVDAPSAMCMIMKDLAQRSSNPLDLTQTVPASWRDLIPAPSPSSLMIPICVLDLQVYVRPRIASLR